MNDPDDRQKPGPVKLTADQQRKIDEILGNLMDSETEKRGTFAMSWGGIHPELPAAPTIRAHLGTLDGHVFTLVTETGLRIGTHATLHYWDSVTGEWRHCVGAITGWRTGLRQDDKEGAVYVSQFVHS
ncbi:hypothetical protein [Acidihalobacter prosperus]|uniref:hypothetical protein n=1 Tax=Acidihalobacter prosperus TaxID=160660 RepID=UPI00056E345D|nr:hypothetical protein [Acidihalobacter prosperus]